MARSALISPPVRERVRMLVRHQGTKAPFLRLMAHPGVDDPLVDTLHGAIAREAVAQNCAVPDYRPSNTSRMA